MSINRWDPFREISHLLAGQFAPMPVPADEGAWQPAADIREDKDAYRLDVELPAVAASDVRIELADGVLLVAGERQAPADEGERAYRRELRYGKFERRFRMPKDADAEAVSASAKDGVVRIVVGKTAKAQSRAIEVLAA